VKDPRQDGILGDVRHTVHLVRHALAVEMDAGRFVQIIREDGPDLVAFHGFEPGPGPGAVEAEGIDRRQDRVDPVADLVDTQIEDLDSAIEARDDGLVAGSLHLAVLTVEESLDDGQGESVVVRLRRTPRRPP
jgi:hypothetical protein